MLGSSSSCKHHHEDLSRSAPQQTVENHVTAFEVRYAKSSSKSHLEYLSLGSRGGSASCSLALCQSLLVHCELDGICSCSCSQIVHARLEPSLQSKPLE